MNTLARFLVIMSLAAMLSGCLGGGVPDVGHRSQAMNKVEAESLPADLMSCDEFYGEDWDTPDSLLGVIGNPGVVVLIQAGEMVCLGQTNQLEDRFRNVDLGELVPLGGQDDSLGMGDDLSVDGESAESPVGDSNPLPARADTT